MNALRGNTARGAATRSGIREAVVVSASARETCAGGHGAQRHRLEATDKDSDEC
jgi:hypothetical protein